MSRLSFKIFRDLLLSTVVLSGLACTPSYGGKGKHQFLEDHDHSQMRKAHQKSTSVIRVEDLANGQFKVVGRITVHEDLIGGQSLWTLPKGTKLISGSLTEALNLEADSSKEVEIVISGLKEGGKIVLLPHKVINNEKHGTPTLYVYGQKSGVSKSSVHQKSQPKTRKRIFQ